jgi:Tol biopolymer transport system component/DNA-binding SARP family transcriptional activator
MTHPEATIPRPGARLSLSTFGNAVLYVDSPDYTEPRRLLGPGKPLALLVFLASSPGREQSREFVAELLWADMDREKAQRAVRQAIWQLKQEIADVLAPSRDRIALAEPIDFDRNSLIDAFNAGNLEEVVRLYRGEFLPDFATPGGRRFEQWAALERETLRGMAVRSAHELVRRQLEQGLARNALTIARRFRDVDRFNQATWRDLIESQLAAGDFIAAAAEADALLKLLQAEEMEPEPSTLSLLKSARFGKRDDPDASRRTTERGTAVEIAAELVGREREFAIIMRGWDSATSGRATLLHLEGPAGIGKTRLLVDIRNRLRAAGHRAVYVRADYGSRGIAFAFVSEVASQLASLRGARGIPPSVASAIVALNPSLSSVFSAERDTSVGEELLRRRSIALRELIVAVAEEQSVALLLDDLHWADTASFDLLDAVLGQIETSRTLVVTAARALPEPRRPWRATAISLAPLSEEAVASLISSIAALPLDSWAATLPQSLHAAAEGSPLLILEMLRLLEERDLLKVVGEQWSAPSPINLASALSTRSAVRHRMSSLAPAERGLALLLAVAGVPLSELELSEALRVTPGEVAALVTPLERRGIVSTHRGVVALAHDEHAAASLDAAERDDARAAAAAVGRAMAKLAGADDARIHLAARRLDEGNDERTLIGLFESFVRRRRAMADFRRTPQLARELLGPSVSDTRLEALERSVPWHVRAGLTSARRVAATMAIAVLGTTSTIAAIAWARARPTDAPDAVLVAYSRSRSTDGNDVFAVPLHETGWGALSGIDIDIGRRPTWHLHSPVIHAPGIRPDGKGWTTFRSMSDSGVIDIVDDDLYGGERRITDNIHDDMEPSWAPDQSQLVFTTTRWNSRGRADLAIYDTLTHQTRQLTSGDDEDVQPIWSSDGSRIAFTRSYWTGGTGICVIDVQGSSLRCLPSARGLARKVEAWVDPHHVAVSIGPDSFWQLVVHDVDTGAEVLVDSAVVSTTAVVSPDGRWVVAQSKRRFDAPPMPIVYPIERPHEYKAISVGPTSLGAAVQFAWAPTSPRPAFVDHLKILTGGGRPGLSARYGLRAVTTDRAGRPISAGAIRWLSLDTMVATIDSDGMVAPRRTGGVRIVATAGGWRADTISLTIDESPDVALMDELWNRDIESQWVPYGVPRPRIVDDTPFGRAFLNNGDDSFFSGAYSARAFDGSRGIWMEAEVAMTATTKHWDDFVLALFTVGDSAIFASWDRRTGDRPGGGLQCRVRYPAGEGASLGDSLEAYRTVPVSRELQHGRTARFLIQVFPDGRCGFALDGRVIHIESRPPGDPPRTRMMHVAVEGRSAGQKVFVGRIAVRSGVARVMNGQ